MIRDLRLALFSLTQQDEKKVEPAFIMRALAFAIANGIIFQREIDAIQREVSLLNDRLERGETSIEFEERFNPNFSQLVRAAKLLRYITQDKLDRAVNYFTVNKSSANVLNLLNYFLEFPDPEKTKIILI